MVSGKTGGPSVLPFSRGVKGRGYALAETIPIYMIKQKQNIRHCIYMSVYVCIA